MACDTQVVKIRENGKVEPDICELSKKGNQRIIWVSEHGLTKDYVVVFDDPKGPFQKGKEFPVPHEGWAESGPLDASAKEKIPYTYTTRDAVTKEVAADPSVIVNP